MGACCSPALIDECRSFLTGDFFKAFVDESRQAIFLLLVENGEMTVKAITDQMSISQSNVSRHLALLKRAGVADSERRGQEIWYRPNYKEVIHRLSSLATVLNQCCRPESAEETS